MTPKRISCGLCHKVKPITSFYSAKASSSVCPDGVVPICKECALLLFNPRDPNSFIRILKAADLPWIPSIYRQVFIKNLEKGHERTAVLGRYISWVKLGQYAQYSYATSEAAQVFTSPDDPFDDPEAYAAASLPLTAPYLAAPADFSIPLGLPVSEDSEAVSVAAASAGPRSSEDAGRLAGGATVGDSSILLSAEESSYLSTKWGSSYSTAQLLRLERGYLEMVQSFDIRTATQKDYLRKICIASMRYDEALASSDPASASKWSSVYSALTKESGLQPVQKSAEEDKSLLSVGLLVKMAENNPNFIPRWDTTEPQDRLDYIIKDYELYINRLVAQNGDISEKLAGAAASLSKQDELVNNGEVASDNPAEEEETEEAPAATTEVTPSFLDIYSSDSLSSPDEEDSEEPEKEEPKNDFDRLSGILARKA